MDELWGANAKRAAVGQVGCLTGCGPLGMGGGVDKKKDEATTYSSACGSTIGAEELNGRVRDGNGCGLLAIITSSISIKKADWAESSAKGGPGTRCAGQSTKAVRAISTVWLNMLPCVHRPPINLVVFQGS